MKKLIISGCGTEVGKTVVSAIFTTLLQADYWKPIQCGTEEDLDSNVIKKLLDMSQHQVHPPSYSLKGCLSPHHAARLANVKIELEQVKLPSVKRTLIIETAGGVLVPLTEKEVILDLFAKWDAHWVVVSKHYLGSINHTLLTIEALKHRGVSILGIVFNGENPDSEKAILEISKLPFLGRLLPEKEINQPIIKKYVEQWQTQLSHLIPC